jgi:hypothetical protein
VNAAVLRNSQFFRYETWLTFFDKYTNYKSICFTSWLTKDIRAISKGTTSFFVQRWQSLPPGNQVYEWLCWSTHSFEDMTNVS